MQNTITNFNPYITTTSQNKWNTKGSMSNTAK